MKVKRPAAEVEVCDRCKREGFLQTCLVCGGRYCLTCDGLVMGCMISADLCRECSKREDVLKIMGRYATQIRPVVKRRDAALKRLPAQPKED